MLNQGMVQIVYVRNWVPACKRQGKNVHVRNLTIKIPALYDPFAMYILPVMSISNHWNLFQKLAGVKK